MLNDHTAGTRIEDLCSKGNIFDVSAETLISKSQPTAQAAAERLARLIEDMEEIAEEIRDLQYQLLHGDEMSVHFDGSEL